MFVTARQLQDLQGRGQVKDEIVLPYGARLTPLAVDWARSKRVKIGYGPEEMTRTPAGVEKTAAAPAASVGAKALLWWCDGPCGAAKAAISAQGRETNLTAVDLPNESAQLVPVIKRFASHLKNEPASGAVLLVKSAAEAIVYANRCRSIRAVVGTCLESVEQGIKAVAANVLIVEYPYKSLSEIRNLLSRFVRGTRNPSGETQRRLEELSSCA